VRTAAVPRGGTAHAIARVDLPTSRVGREVVGQAVPMAREIPEVVRAAAGLAATVLDEARRLPETLPGLPVRIIGLAMQQAMKVQQQYAGLVARGDELFTGMRGADEPGLATFDDEVEPVVVPPPGFRDSAFDRAADTSRDAAAYPVADAQDDEIPATHEILDELAIDEMVGDAPGPADSLDAADTVDTADNLDTADILVAEPAADVPTAVDVLTPGGQVTTVEATVTDEGIAAPEGAPEDATDTDTDTGTSTATDEGGAPVAAATGVRTDVGGPDTSAEDAAIAEGAAVDAVGGESAAPTDDPEGGSELSGSQAAGTAPIDGYDSFSIAQLRGRLRGYALSTVQDLLAYEEATRAREPYLKMLRNRLEKLEEQAVASSPLAPRGA
jgi:hypothetical protein